MADDSRASWAAERRRAADHHAEVARRQAASDAAKAQAMLDSFVEAATRQLPTQRLRARAFGGTRRYRTDRHGWYLRRDHSIGVDADATYLVLTVPGSLLGVLRGVAVPAATPPLVVGRGGPDGVAIDLRELLAKRLAAGPDF